MQIDVTKSRERISVGPPGGPTEKIAAACTIKVTGLHPYDLRIRLEWVASEAKLSVRELNYAARPGGEPVRLANINRMALTELLRGALETAFLGAEGWAGVLARHPDDDQVAVDALIYLLAVALDSQKPSATVAMARGMSPASGPKRVATSRKAGLIPKTAPGRAAGA